MENTRGAHSTFAERNMLGRTAFFHIQNKHIGREDVAAFEEEMKSAFKDITEVATLAIDLQEVDYLCSEGIVSILTLRKDALADGRRVILVDIGDKVRNSLDQKGMGPELLPRYSSKN